LMTERMPGHFSLAHNIFSCTLSCHSLISLSESWVILLWDTLLLMSQEAELKQKMPHTPTNHFVCGRMRKKAKSKGAKL
jgi:hypothetical protein